jgi:hypothetical protein
LVSHVRSQLAPESIVPADPAQLVPSAPFVGAVTPLMSHASAVQVAVVVTQAASAQLGWSLSV